MNVNLGSFCIYIYNCKYIAERILVAFMTKKTENYFQQLKLKQINFEAIICFQCLIIKKK